MKEEVKGPFCLFYLSYLNKHESLLLLPPLRKGFSVLLFAERTLFIILFSFLILFINILIDSC